jgi:hypothetical protein
MALPRSTNLADFPLEHVGEIHLAGHAQQADDEGELLLIDSHDCPVADAVRKLFDVIISRCGPIPTLIEWDSDLPRGRRVRSWNPLTHPTVRHCASGLAASLSTSCFHQTQAVGWHRA